MYLDFRKQRGFSILAVILVIVTVVVAIGAWSLSGQSNIQGSGSSTTDIQASSIINDSGSIKSTFDNLLINGANANNIVFSPNTASTPTAPNMLDPTNGMAFPAVGASAIRDYPRPSEGIWVYNKTGFVGNKVATTAVDYAIFLGGIKNSVCQRINYALHGSTTIPPSTYFSATSDATAANPTSTLSITLDGAPNMIGWTSGCLSTNLAGDNNFYFRILKAN